MRKEAVMLATVTTVAVVAVLVRQNSRKKQRRWKQTQRILRKFARESATPVPKLWEVANALVSDMQASLVSQEETSTLNMLVSYAASLPKGDEKGLYYGLNLRGTNFLILCARLGGRNEPISDLYRKEISIPPNVLSGTSQELFDYIAVELAKFFVSEHPPDDTLDAPEREKKLGFTVSYPVDQAAAISGSAIKWKSFSANDTVGKALVNDINQALEKHGLNFRVFSLVDDTVGNLAGGRCYNNGIVASVTLAMGSNAAYVEPNEAVPKWQGPMPSSNVGELVINTEWGNFNCSNLPVTEFDSSLDSESSNPGCRIFEKLTSAMYLGEIVRRVLLKMAQETALFGDVVPPKLATPYQLRSPDMAAMHQDTSEDHGVVGEKLKENLGITNSSPMVREVVAEVCDIVAERGARLAGAGIVGIIKKLGRIESRKSVVTVEGGLYEHYRVFRNYLHSSVWEMLGSDHSDNVVIEHSHGGSGAGAVFLAACQNTKSS
ncbi:PREDICTED: probable hexokinase-like 2 protein [Populus euphratica]|uniref:Phosphotransferase n=1 Tax=Populus euphratica TaxID=75702 RepID=A0AAJ6XKB2_POPEU|nr:PREDICTED: probable hexokinase-like 2 protein [Populus euphratica]